MQANIWVSSSGSLTIDSWEEHVPEFAGDPIIGTIRGQFESELTCWAVCDGQSETVEVTDGVLCAQVEKISMQ